MFDTASSYGDSEKRIGNYNFKKKVFSKIFLRSEHYNSDNSLISEVKKSLKLIKTKRLEGLFVHNPNYLIRNKKKELIN